MHTYPGEHVFTNLPTSKGDTPQNQSNFNINIVSKVIGSFHVYIRHSTIALRCVISFVVNYMQDVDFCNQRDPNVNQIDW